VANVGDADTAEPIYVDAITLCGELTTVLAFGLEASDSESVSFTFYCSANYTGCQTVTVEVDEPNFVDECDEDNNVDDMTVCCAIK